MNFTEFIKKVDAAAERMPAENMAAFLHDYARSVPEHKRKAFLERLFSFAGQSLEKDQSKKQDASYQENLKKEIEKALEQLACIDNGEIALAEVINEEYDDWYGEDDDILYEDPENICEAVQKGCDLVHECADREMYQEGYGLADFLLQMEISTDGEYYGDTLSLRDLASQGLIQLDYESFLTDALLSAYWGNPLEERPDALYWILENASDDKITLESLMQKSPRELDQLPEFLVLWIGYLGKANGKRAERLLQEAVDLTDNPDVLLDAARKYTDLHPVLYLQALEQYRETGQIEHGLEIGKEALERISSNCQIRSQAALMTAELALVLKRKEEAEHCWLEAFRSVCSEVNYLRLVLECQDYGKYQQEAEGIYMASLGKPSQQETARYCQRNDAYYALLFFSGKFRQMIAEGMQEKEALGWSGTFMKEGMALLFLSLYQGKNLPKGCAQMCSSYIDSIGFHPETYLKGTGRTTELSGQAFFWECFCKWREHICLPEQDVQYILEKLERWVRLRVKGIMENNRRNYYRECAAFVAALGEVKESRGERGGKSATMEGFRSAYPRRRAFHQELRDFGM